MGPLRLCAPARTSSVFLQTPTDTLPKSLSRRHKVHRAHREKAKVVKPRRMLISSLPLPLFPSPFSPVPVPCSLPFFIPNCLFPIPHSLFPIPHLPFLLSPHPNQPWMEIGIHSAIIPCGTSVITSGSLPPGWITQVGSCYIRSVSSGAGSVTCIYNT